MAYKAYFCEDDCISILRKSYPDLELKKYTLEPFSEELRGYLGEHLLLTIETTSSAKFTYFVKSTKTASLSECFKDTNLFERELLLYRFVDEAKKLLHNVDALPLPKFVHSNADEMLVLENLETQGYTGGGLKFTEAEVVKAVEALAKFHALSLGYEEVKRAEPGGGGYELPQDYGEFPDPIFRRNKESSSYKWMKSTEIGILALIDLYMTDEPEKAAVFKDSFLNSITKLYKLINEKNDYRKVICNGDLWGKNVLFKYENGEVVDSKLVDFQYIRYAPPAFDLALLLYFTSDGKLYQKVNHFYKLYYARLRDELRRIGFDISTILPLAEFRETCRVYAECAKITWLMYRSMTSANYLSMKDISDDMNFYKSVVFGKKRVWFITENFYNDKPYREFVGKIFYDVYDSITKAYPVERCFEVVESAFGEDYTFLGYDVTNLSVRGGFLGEHSILEILVEAKKQVKLRYFLKQPPIAKTQRDFAADTNALFKENQFYQKLLPDFVSNNIPMIAEISAKCYHIDEEGLVMQDLQNLGFYSTDKRTSMSLAEVLIVLKTLAKLHASGLIYEERLGVKLLENYTTEFSETFYQTSKSSLDLLKAAKNGIGEQIKIFNAGAKLKDLHQKISKIVDAFCVLTKPSSAHRNTICHGDLWANNILLNSEKAYLVDFQSYRYAPPAHDLMQFIYLSTDRRFRAENLPRVLDEYLQHLNAMLTENNCTPIERSAFLESCEFERIMAVVQSVTHFHNVLMSDERMDYVFANNDYWKMIIFEDRSDNIKSSCEMDPLFRERNGEAIYDAADLCLELANKGFDFDNITRL